MDTHWSIGSHFLVSQRCETLAGMWRRATEIIGSLGKGPCNKRIKGFSLLNLIKTSSNDFSDYSAQISAQGENTEQ